MLTVSSLDPNTDISLVTMLRYELWYVPSDAADIIVCVPVTMEGL